MSYSQYLRAFDMSVALSLSRQNYWHDGVNNHYTLSLSKSASFGPLRNVNMSLSLARSQTLSGQTENQVYASLSIPLGDNRQLSYGYQRSGQDRLQPCLLYTSRCV